MSQTKQIMYTNINLLFMKFCEDTTGKYIRENSQKKNSNNQNIVPIFKAGELIT